MPRLQAEARSAEVDLLIARLRQGPHSDSELVNALCFLLREIRDEFTESSKN